MTLRDEIREMEGQLKRAGASVLQLCAEAGINRATWTRWKSGKNRPNMATWESTKAAFDDLVSVQQ